jgi:hypothetical protein
MKRMVEYLRIGKRPVDVKRARLMMSADNIWQRLAKGKLAAFPRPLVMITTIVVAIITVTLALIGLVLQFGDWLHPLRPRGPSPFAKTDHETHASINDPEG